MHALHDRLPMRYAASLLLLCNFIGLWHTVFKRPNLGANIHTLPRGLNRSFLPYTF
ncbi:hypothetical protein AA0481_1182 [Acetobacter orientalis NRIC 0481]|nr:hypothetical protein AA0481_1182 [Acetobacter orientalis NRIC 0481]